MAGSSGNEETQVGIKFFRQTLHPLLGFVAAACLLTLVGWTGDITALLHWVTCGTGVAFAMERAWVFFKYKLPQSERKRLKIHVSLAVAVFLTSVTLMILPLSSLGEKAIASHIFIQSAVLVSSLASMIYHQTRFTARAFHPGLILIFSFLALIVGGTLLLMMPRCVTPGNTCTWLEALFTSTSAVCVTGLNVQNTATFFSLTGQIVILLLIQIGGLGIMTLTFFAAVVLFEGLSLHDRLLLGKMLSENRLARIGQTLSFIVAFTFIAESIGAVILFMYLDSIPDFGMRLFHSVFHAVSAFCNAGFSTLPDGLASEAVQGNRVWQIVVMILIVIGGLGALVCEDISQWVVAMIKIRKKKKGPRPRLKVHSRLVLSITAGLIIIGALAIFTSEFLFGSGPQNGGTILTSLFHSVTARTAGFNTVPMSQISLLTAEFLMLLMIIGGSPGGTAGGMRTTVFAVAIAHVWSQLRMSRRGMIVFNRRIPAEVGTQALGLIVLTGIWLIINFTILIALESGKSLSERELLFELISAFATVGLSLDVTPLLTPSSQILLTINMFVGRIGLFTVLATLIPPDNYPSSGKPPEKILLI